MSKISLYIWGLGFREFGVLGFGVWGFGLGFRVPDIYHEDWGLRERMRERVISSIK